MIVYGKRIVEYVLETHPEIVKEVLISKKSLFKTYGKYKPKLIDNKVAQKLSRNQNHQGVFAKIEFEYIEPEIEGNKILVLDSITDMGNIGAIIRSAYSLGIDLVIITGIKELKWDRVIRTSAGAAIDMPILIYNNILELVNVLKTKGYSIVGADLGGKSQVEAQKIALIMGNEGEGLNKRLKSKLDEVLTIPMKRDFNSLNVSVAAGILIDRIVNGC